MVKGSNLVLRMRITFLRENKLEAVGRRKDSQHTLYTGCFSPVPLNPPWLGNLCHSVLGYSSSASFPRVTDLWCYNKACNRAYMLNTSHSVYLSK